METALSLNKNLFEIEFNGKVLGLAPREYDLLVVLIEESHRVVGRVELVRKVWTEGKPLSRVVDTYICRLRSKLHTSDTLEFPRHGNVATDLYQ